MGHAWFNNGSVETPEGHLDIFKCSVCGYWTTQADVVETAVCRSRLLIRLAVVRDWKFSQLRKASPVLATA